MKIKVFEAFAGIGAQHKSISWVNKQIKSEFEVVATSDWDIRAIISYASIHNGLSEAKVEKICKNKFDSKAKIDEYLSQRIFSSNSKTPIKYIKRLPMETKKVLVVANYLNNNFPDINAVSGEILDLHEIDLLTYSFPCQGLSVANMGRSKGINDDSSTSHLVWQIGKILKQAKNKPKYLLLENVKNLVNQYHAEYEQWKDQLKKLGYKNFTAVFNANDFGSLQKRERVFVISVLKSIKTPFKNDAEYKEYLLSLGSKHKLTTLEQRKKEYHKIFDLNNKNLEELNNYLVNNTPSRVRMINEGRDLNDLEFAHKNKYTINTLTTKQDRIPNVGYLNLKANNSKKLDYRFVSPRESYKIMGFEDKDFDKLKPFINSGILTKEALWRQAGNSIDVNVLKRIFEAIWNIHLLNSKGDKNGEKK
ncbi:DNA (cytosine-5-)-methyltransferase [Mycoplasmopsis pullorum]|uniref:DNA (cytosine-5-)-methyltransferase n=2 Tax=Mycoplasmopsis pullorum TaxID=48003 RepID=UPI001118F312|nr:DNA (cytosine-5-)-methyltransferase [Mycoplasmopsis pullorum]TNK82949.1 DNA (cytosine-5-)-methyltransferase [Mycoplasmopsis pullorum]TNK92277.1 DNA (cytosine-5-)-methyltransferase [Mycoplasmopsis pullorum]